MRFDGIIFDWAGTTVDYGCFAPVKAFIEAFEHYGITPTLEEVRKPMGMLKIDHVRTMLSMERISRLWEEKQGKKWTEEDVRKVYELSESKILGIVENYGEPKPYVVETVEKLRKMGLKIGSTTGYTSTNKKGRPYPYMIFRNMEKLELKDVSRVMKVGDTVSDILEGKNAGLVTVGVLEGSSVMGLTREEYEALTEEEREAADKKAEKTYLDAGADYVVRDVRGILDLLE